MDMVIPNEGKQFWLNRALQNGSALNSNLQIHLFINDLTPDDNSVFASFDPATFDGSISQNLSNGNWSGATIDADVAESTHTPAPSWTNTGATTETAYGWYAFPEGDSICVAAQRFDTPHVMSPGEIETLTPATIKLKTFS